MGTKTVTEDRDFYNPHDLLKKQPGRYLDVVEREQSEELRAEAEDREPDYENLPAGAGTPLSTKEQLPNTVIGGSEDPEVFVTLPVDNTVVTDEDDEKPAAKKTTAKKTAAKKKASSKK